MQSGLSELSLVHKSKCFRLFYCRLLFLLFLCCLYCNSLLAGTFAQGSISINLVISNTLLAQVNHVEDSSQNHIDFCVQSLRSTPYDIQNARQDNQAVKTNIIFTNNNGQGFCREAAEQRWRIKSSPSNLPQLLTVEAI